MEITKHRKTTYVSEYRLGFEYVDPSGVRRSGGSGYSFDCDAEGKVDESTLNPLAKKNLEGCRSGHIDRKQIFCTGIREYGRQVTEDAEGCCDCCGTTVVLGSFTNTCDGCGADYNMSGQRLASREQWGYETGETLADILSI